MIRDDCDELAGMTDARLIDSGMNRTQSVTVGVQYGLVTLNIDRATYPAGLTVAQARFLARKLYRMARLLEQRGATS